MAIDALGLCFAEQQVAMVVGYREVVTAITVDSSVGATQAERRSFVIVVPELEGLETVAHGTVGLERIGRVSPPRLVVNVPVARGARSRDGFVADRETRTVGERPTVDPVALVALCLTVLSP